MEHTDSYGMSSVPLQPSSGQCIEMAQYGQFPSWGVTQFPGSNASLPSQPSEPQPEEEERITSYDGILVTTNSFAQIFNDLRWFHRHFQRSQEAEALLKNVASPDEQLHLAKDLGCKQMVVVNMLVWRRSLMKVLVLFVLITSVVQGDNARDQWLAAWRQYKAVPMEHEYSKWKLKAPDDKNGFQHYTLAVIKEIRRLMVSQADIVRALGNLVIQGLAVCSLFLCWTASTSWLNFRASRKKLIYAWLLSVAAPFLVSMVPARLFVDWSKTRELVKSYKDELDQQFGIDSKLQMLKSNCARITTEGDTKLVEATDGVKRICTIVDEKLPRGEITVPTTWKFWKGFSPVTVNLDQVHDGCTTANAFLAEEPSKPKEALAKAQEACRQMQGLLDQYSKNYGETPQVIHYFAEQIEHVAEASVALSLALQNFGVLFPAALSIAPGVLKGALRMKMLVPQSMIPGMIVLVLPCMYCPLAWCMYSLAFQLIGNCFLLTGLILTAFNPMCYVVFGQIYQLAKPMSDKQVLEAILKIQRAIKVVSFIGYGFLAYFVGYVVYTYASKQNFWGLDLHAIGIKKKEEEEESWGSKQESKLLSMVFHVDDWSKFIWNLIETLFCLLCGTMRSFYLTSAAGVDWMVDEMVQFRAVEKAMLESSTHDDVVKEYTARMDQLLALDRGVRASVYQRPQDGWQQWGAKLFHHGGPAPDAY